MRKGKFKGKLKLQKTNITKPIVNENTLEITNKVPITIKNQEIIDFIKNHCELLNKIQSLDSFEKKYGKIDKILTIFDKIEIVNYLLNCNFNNIFIYVDINNLKVDYNEILPKCLDISILKLIISKEETKFIKNNLFTISTLDLILIENIIKLNSVSTVLLVNNYDSFLFAQSQTIFNSIRKFFKINIEIKNEINNEIQNSDFTLLYNNLESFNELKNICKTTLIDYEIFNNNPFNICLNTNICIISIFYNNQTLLPRYEENIRLLKDYKIILVDNCSTDKTYDELVKFSSKYSNVQVIKNIVNGCSSGRNLGIDNTPDYIKYLVFLDSDYIIKSHEIITNLKKNISDETKYVGYYGGQVDNFTTVTGLLLDEKKEYVIEKSDNLYLGCGCSMVDYSILKENSIRFDTKYDPFTIQDVDFSYQIKQIYKLKKLSITNDIIHLGNQTTKKFKKDIRRDLIKNNSQYFFNKFIINNKNEETEDTTFNFFSCFNISTIHISQSLKHLDRIKSIFKLDEFNPKKQPENLAIFGLYNLADKKILTSFRGNIYIVWGGTDEEILDLNTEKIIKKKFNIYHFAISDNIEERLEKRGFSNIIRIDLDLTNNKIFKPIDKLGNKIFIYNGYSKSIPEARYGKEIYEQVIKLLPDYQYVFSNSLGGIPNEKMFDIYKECFIGLRLTEKDGNANMVSEMKAMGIPVIHNLSNYGLKWKSVDDIVNLIEDQFVKTGNKKDIKIEDFNKFRIDILKTNFYSDEDLKQINKNIELFSEFIENYKNILLISGDFPSYGGAATNCSKIAEFLAEKNHNIFSFYFNYETDPSLVKNYKSDTMIIGNLNELEKIMFNPDLIILKSPVSFDLKKRFKCPIYYLVGGIYNNSLDKYFSELKQQKQHDRRINHSVLNQIKNSDLTFVNSMHTQDVLKLNYRLDTYLFYSSFIPFLNQTPFIDYNFENRKYNYGLIVSNFNRRIKNIETSISFLKDKTDVILIGKNSEKYRSLGFECIDLINNNQLLDFYKSIKYIIQDSYYESASNVKIEAIFNGCQIINKDFIPPITLPPKLKYNGEKIVILDSFENKYKYENFSNKIYDYLFIYISDKNKLITSSKNVLIIDKDPTIYLNIIIEKLVKENHLDLLITNKTIIENFPLIYSKLSSLFRQVDYKYFQTLLLVKKPIKLFINFKPKTIEYGGGNQFVLKLINFLEEIDQIKITFELDDDIDIFFLIDLRKDKSREFKKYSFDEIYNKKLSIPNSKIIYRVNDCDITRVNKELEKLIITNIEKIDYYIFNSDFIRDYYFNKYDIFNSKKTYVIYNNVNSQIFYPKQYLPITNRKIRVVTHHWSDNINKGYEFYYQFYNYCKTSTKYEFIFIGRKFNDSFTDHPKVIGPYSGFDLAEQLRNCDIYLSASIYDACPMHILEGISCGLPVLYYDQEGGLKDICELSDEPIGEKFYDFETMLNSLEKIVKNYEFYYLNIIKNILLFNSEECYKKYVRKFLEI